VRLITFRSKSADRSREGSAEEIGALTDGEKRLVRLQAAEQLRRGESSPHLISMIAFLEAALRPAKRPRQRSILLSRKDPMA
jgi:hypothetical protein